jgi:hypothetical protein
MNRREFEVVWALVSTPLAGHLGPLDMERVWAVPAGLEATELKHVMLVPPGTIA